jgi:hypothetical protein
MSGSRFWARGRAWPQESEQADGAEVLDETLTAVDRCDRCGARAYVRVLLPNRLELLSCAHHNRQYAAALTKIAVEASRSATARTSPSTSTAPSPTDRTKQEAVRL